MPYTDIVKRLRKAGAPDQNGAKSSLSALLLDAADEIEFLRLELFRRNPVRGDLRICRLPST